MSENNSDLNQQLAEVKHEIDNLSPNMEPGAYLQRSKELASKKKVLEARLSGESETGIEVTYTQDVDTDPFFKDYDVELKSKDPRKKKKAFKMLSAFSILFIIIAVLVIVAIILNARHVRSDIIKPIGVVDIFVSVFYGFRDKWDIIVFILIIGAFITVVMSSKALDGFAQGITKKMQGKEVYALIPLMFFFSLLGTVEGFAEESLGFYLFLIPVMIMCGFDVFTAVMAILLGAGIGVMTSVVNPFIVTVAVKNMSSSAVDISMGDGIAWRVITWFLFTSAAIGIVMWYAMRVKKNPTKSITFSTYEGDKMFFLGENNEDIKMDWKKKLTLVVFLIGFALMIVYLIDWDAITGNNTMKNAGHAVNTKAWWFTSNIPGFGYGGLEIPAMFFMLAAVVCGIINGFSEQGFIKKFMEGAADMLSVCLIIAVAGGVNWVLVKSGLKELFADGLSHLDNLGGIGKTIVFYLIFLPLSFLIPSSTGFASAIFPALGGVITNQVSATGLIQAFAFATGLINLFSPTSGVVMGAVGLSRMDYKTFLKGMAPILGIFFILSIAFLAIGGAIGGVSGITPVM